MATVIEIVKAYLEENGFDGLYAEDECGCKKDDLAPCGELGESCNAGYLQKDIEEGLDWSIGPKDSE
jgi:hypothetical protein